ncbi:hypothetical protein PHISCL_02001 [Aspergillus sclerotialis]|uniref:CWF21 domain-containing protein n=1 Tax=Aspergillus sclerotialis TaxID=2070753 RepID=A0A3A3A1V7_9EURO|nr:hypothetical protein PHISCL_02001 [Aspergillus sclerotialis]
MSENVGLSTPRGSGTSGYVQRNWAFMKPRNAGYGAPYPPVKHGDNDAPGAGFRHRQPDKKILEHDRRRNIEVKVLEERERLEELNEEIEEEKGKGKGKGSDRDGERRVLSEEEIDERCEELRAKLLKELEEDEASGRKGPGGKEKRQFKSYQVHELAEAKIEESERLRKALGIKEDKETGEISSARGAEWKRRGSREQERERE